MLTQKEILEKLISVEQGDPESVKELMRYFYEIVDAGGVPDSSVLEFVATAFKGVIDGETMKKAFGIEKAHGRPPEDKSERDFLLAIYLYLLKKKGLGVEEARRKLADKLHVSDSTIKKAWSKYKNQIDAEHIEMAKDLLTELGC